jgi:hypothetical protein
MGLEGKRDGSNAEAILRMQHESNMKTLSLLQKTIMKEDDLFYPQ